MQLQQTPAALIAAATILISPGCRNQISTIENATTEIVTSCNRILADANPVGWADAKSVGESLTRRAEANGEYCECTQRGDILECETGPISHHAPVIIKIGSRGISYTRIHGGKIKSGAAYVSNEEGPSGKESACIEENAERIGTAADCRLLLRSVRDSLRMLWRKRN